MGITEAAATGQTATRVQDASHKIVEEVAVLRSGVTKFLQDLRAS